MALISGWGASRARAEAPPPPAAVVVRVAGLEPAAIVDALGGLVDEPLRGEAVARVDLVEVLGPEPSSESPVRLWVDATGPEMIRVYVRDDRGDRVLFRTVDRDGPDDLAEIEAAVQILGGALDALRDGIEVGEQREAVREAMAAEGMSADTPPSDATPAAPPPSTSGETASEGTGRALAPSDSAASAASPPDAPATEPNPTAAASDALRARVALGGFLRAYAPAALPVAVGPWLAGELAVPVGGGLAVALGLEARYAVELVLDADPAGASLHGLALRARVGLEGALDDALVGRIVVVGGSDLTFVTPRAAAGVRAADPFVVLAPVLGARLGLRWRFAPPLALELAVGAEVDVAGTRFVWRDGDAVQVALEPWPLRPVALLGLSLP